MNDNLIDPEDGMELWQTVLALVPETLEARKVSKTEFMSFFSDLFEAKIWSGRRDSNSRLSAWEADILPLNYSR